MSRGNRFGETPVMKSWQDIPGWFNFAAFYDEVVELAGEGDELAEVGCWLGRSTAYLAQRLAEKGLHCPLYAVDTWKGDPSSPKQQEGVAEHGGDLFPQFRRNMIECGVFEWIYPLQEDSAKAAARFEDASLFFVFIDADHDFEPCSNDIRAWLPKVRPGGILAGHDFHTYESVRQAVRHTLGGGFEVRHQCWVRRA
jgi:SAM-dependent methyltransferase